MLLGFYKVLRTKVWVQNKRSEVTDPMQLTSAGFIQGGPDWEGIDGTGFQAG